MGFARATVAALAALGLCAASDPPPPPPGIADYIEEGRFEPGDYGWARGAFADATPEQAEAWHAAADWPRRAARRRATRR